MKVNTRLLIAVIDNNRPVSCLGIGGWEAPNSWFPTLSTVQQQGLGIQSNVVVHYQDTHIYPDLMFTCDGSITSVIALVGVVNSYSDSQLRLQIWDKIDAAGYTYQLSSSVNVHYPYQGFDTLQLLNVTSTPIGLMAIPFKNGSILGLHKPRVFVNGGSRSYRITYGGTTDRERRDYPLVGVVTSTFALTRNVKCSACIS